MNTKLLWLLLFAITANGQDTLRTGYLGSPSSTPSWGPITLDWHNPDPCESTSTYWPIILQECENNPMHCRHCGKELKQGESFAYVVIKVERQREYYFDSTSYSNDNVVERVVKYADFIHIRCALKRIR